MKKITNFYCNFMILYIKYILLWKDYEIQKYTKEEQMAKEKEELNLEETKVKNKNDNKISKEENVSIESLKKEDRIKVSKSTNKQKETKKLEDDVITDKKNIENKSIRKQSKTSIHKKNSNAKSNSSKTINSSKNEKINEKNKEVTPNTEKVKEETIIEKIKSFISKIVAMQEEAKNEELSKKEIRRNAKKAGTIEKIKNTEEPGYLTEYYDLPYRYNETVVKILAQTPKRIFVYWDVADEDKIRYENAFGNDFFEKTYPVLLVHNDDKNYTTEIPINDFANSWYIDIKDPKTKYSIQLGRKFREVPKNIDVLKIKEQNIILKTDYLPIAQSNLLEVPNDRVLFASLPKVIKFRNVKTYEEKEQVISEMKTIYGNIYDIKEFYEENYKEEIDDGIFDINNPTSGGLSSSSFR